MGCGLPQPRRGEHQGEYAGEANELGWHPPRYGGIHLRMSEPELTQEMIAEDMARGEQVACSPGDARCYPLPDPLTDARQTGLPKGRRTLG